MLDSIMRKTIQVCNIFFYWISFLRNNSRFFFEKKEKKKESSMKKEGTKWTKTFISTLTVIRKSNKITLQFNKQQWKVTWTTTATTRRMRMRENKKMNKEWSDTERKSTLYILHRVYLWTTKKERIIRTS